MILKGTEAQKGYRKDSPYKHLPKLIIDFGKEGGTITMKDVEFPLFLVSDKNETAVLYPGQEKEFKGRYVTEYPIRR